MSVHLMNCFTCNARWPERMKTGLVCLVVDTNAGPVLVDTGLGLQDYSEPTWFTQFYRVITYMPFDPEEAAINRIKEFGYSPKDIKNIILTHMHFDHCGGLPDLPWAKVHVHKREFEAFIHAPRRFIELGYVRRHINGVADWALYDSNGDTWFGFDAIRLPGFEPQIWLIPLFGHTQGHCGVAIQTEGGWHLHCGDAGVDIENNFVPDWLIATVLGPHWPRLRAFARSHPEIRTTASHMDLRFFEDAV